MEGKEEVRQSLADQQQKAMRGRFGLNVLTNYISFFINLFISLYLTRFLLQSLGKELFGAWSLIGSIMMYLGLVDLGFGSSIQKFVAEYAAAGEEKRISRLISTSAILLGALALLLILLSIAATPLLGSVFKLSPEYVDQARHALILMGIVQGVALPLGILSGTLLGLQRMDIQNAVGIVGSIANFLLILAFVSLGWGLPGVCIAYLGVTIAAGLVKILFVKNLLPGVRPSFSQFDWSIVRSTSTYGITFFGLKIAHFLKYNTDSMVISAFLSVAMVTPFAIANRLATLIRQLVEQAVDILVPVFSQLHRLQDEETIKRVYLQAGKLTVGLAAPIALFVCLFARDILVVWLENPPEKADILTIILSLTVFASIVPAVSVKLMLGVARHRALALWTLADSVANLVLSIILVGPYGLVGVALGTTIPLVISHVFVFPWLGCRIIGLSTVSFLFILTRAFVLPLIPVYFLLWSLSRVWHPGGGLELLVLFVSTCLLYGTLFAFLSIDREERIAYRDRLARILPERGSA